MVIPKRLRLAHAATWEEAVYYLNLGYEPVECSFGSRSVLGRFRLDHHGLLSHEKPVSIKAAELAREGMWCDKFVVTGPPDPDAIYAIAVLSQAILPDLEIAEAIAVTDLDPIGVDRILQSRHTREVLFDLSLGEPLPTVEGFYQALNCGIRYFHPRTLSSEELNAARQYEESRIAKVMASVIESHHLTILLEWNRIGRDVWHRSAPLAVQYKPEYGIISVSGCTRMGAERLGTLSVYDVLGEKGLNTFYPVMDEVLGRTGSGGRPDIGGGPRGVRFSFEDAKRVFNALEGLIEAEG